ncbi:cyclic AMP-dependent transcription factor ATF-6 alpha [Platysternon megacephalum]|uniref:Cyclic AMP-dependent transcription factor ATF-6 alpha n=1 Tax=Platysternon megacephalum TaxID=55544 RepID=A0A4D9DR28_9SAUR|nr:cyclic AMP-dependent transcription factor ATF-6 alpha [Platysternon megacephalum]
MGQLPLHPPAVGLAPCLQAQLQGSHCARTSLASSSYKALQVSATQQRSRQLDQAGFSCHTLARPGWILLMELQSNTVRSLCSGQPERARRQSHTCSWLWGAGHRCSPSGGS